ncbi:E3 ubiquitin-protein ligase TRIM35 [Labeo rohita]|uniref:E3 ubiquitin-protein ligase TRIM35 n=1 Tax=Labeo rohita TaxID=84645 RepID=A0ABQ8M6W1_LABRO|nr:E3 ubiquitin-protein ligase TRIM35 [Labeo rohita]
MTYQALISEEDLHCPVCFELFTNPVVLECSHSFCRTCIDNCWNGQFTRICPVCRASCLSERPPANLALRNIVENFRVRQQSNVEEPEQSSQESQERESTQSPEERCATHGKRFFFFCEDDQETLCTVCQYSKRHKDHQLIPLEEAAKELKEMVRLSLWPLKEDLMTFQTQKDECLKTTQHIKEQTRLTRDLIKKDFEQLRHFLRLEEAARISMLEDEAEMKNEIMQEKLEDLSNKIVSLSNTIQNRETDLEREDIQFLQAYKSYTDSVIYSPQDSNVLAPDSLIDVSKHVGNLKFKVWEKMLGQVQYKGGQYCASTKPWTKLYVKRKPHRIRVCLNNNNKELSFYDPFDMTHIYTFSHLPTKKLIPFFSPCVSDQGSNTEPLRIVPVKVAVTITPELAD